MNPRHLTPTLGNELRQSPPPPTYRYRPGKVQRVNRATTLAELAGVPEWARKIK